MTNKQTQECSLLNISKKLRTIGNKMLYGKKGIKFTERLKRITATKIDLYMKDLKDFDIISSSYWNWCTSGNNIGINVCVNVDQYSVVQNLYKDAKREKQHKKEFLNRRNNGRSVKYNFIVVFGDEQNKKENINNSEQSKVNIKHKDAFDEANPFK